MKQEDRELLLKDLCARLPYYTKCEMIDELRVVNNEKNPSYVSTLFPKHIELFSYHNNFTIKPYLRPMSSMTEEERKELLSIVDNETHDIIEQLKNEDCGILEGKYHFNALREFDWLNSHHFDYRTIYDENKKKWVTMIEKGLALEAPEGMYK